MAFNKSPHPALLLDEVVKHILEYAASGEPFEKTKELRAVCKQWREMSFMGLCQSCSLPAISLRHDKKGRLKLYETTFETLRRRFPQTSSAGTTLSEPQLPIEIKINRLPRQRDVADIRRFSRAITSVRICPEEDNRFIENQTYDFKLPNLRRLHVFWGNVRNYEPWQRVVNCIFEASKKHIVLKYIYDLYNRYQPSPLPIAHRQLRQLYWMGVATDLGELTTPTLKHLVEVEFLLTRCVTASLPGKESAAITEILERHSSTLQKVDIFLTSSVKTLCLPRGQLPQLLALESNSPILLSKDESNPTNLPKLTTLKYVVGYHPLKESDGFRVAHLASNSLRRLQWRWPKSSLAEGEQEKRNKDHLLLLEFEEQHFPVYPELFELNIDNMPFCFGLAMMPQVVNCMQNLVRLSIDLVRTPGRLRPWWWGSDATDDLLKILTGVTRRDIPTDPNLWPGFLKHQTNAITNLTNLCFLRIHSTDSTERIFGGFIFHAAFFQMQYLKMIKLSGGISVEWKMINEWRSSGREIDAYGVDSANSNQARRTCFPTVHRVTCTIL